MSDSVFLGPTMCWAQILDLNMKLMVFVSLMVGREVIHKTLNAKSLG
jgi:hypothetical protein